LGAVTAQSYRERWPASPLRKLVSSVWVQRVAPGAAPYRHRTIPHGSIEIACEIGAVPQVVGPQTGPRVETLAPGTTVVGLRFRPGAAPAVLGMPASEFVDLSVPVHELWGSELGERLAAAASPAEAAATLEAEVLGRSAAADGPDPVVAETTRRLLPWRAGDVGSLPSSLYISERQLRRRCRAAIGLAPKVVHRMLRFQGFLALAQGRADADLARLAAEAGYADQSHLTRESLRLAGLSPRALLLEAGEHCAAVHDHTVSYAPLLFARR
jgi:AraC-like DNA-binding protein